MTYTTFSFILFRTISERKRPSRHIVEKAALKWAWVDSNYRPHAYQAVIKQAKSRQNAVLFTGRTHDLPLFPQIMPEYAGIYRPNNRPKRHKKWPNLELMRKVRAEGQVAPSGPKTSWAIHRNCFSKRSFLTLHQFEMLIEASCGGNFDEGRASFGMERGFSRGNRPSSV